MIVRASRVMALLCAALLAGRGAAAPPAYVWLPAIQADYCPAFRDDFSDPASGWLVASDDLARFEYLDGAYRILAKRPGFLYRTAAPHCPGASYTVQADARWAGASGSSYGLIFGVAAGYSAYYLFDVNSDYREFRLARRGPSGFTEIVPPTASPAIRPGAEPNRLMATRSGSRITLAVNGMPLGTWTDAMIGGLTGAGLAAAPYSDLPNADARFDTFTITPLPAAAPAGGPGEPPMPRPAGLREARDAWDTQSLRPRRPPPRTNRPQD